MGADGAWAETYLSVNWMEHLPDGLGTHAEKLERLRNFIQAPPLGVPVFSLRRNMMFAVVPVVSVRAANLVEVGTTLHCEHVPEPSAVLDPHAAIRPDPGVESWPANKDAPAHLMIQQYLWSQICHFEPALF